MEGRLNVLSVQRSTVTAVPFPLSHCYTIYSSKIVQKKKQNYFLLFLPQMQNCVRWKFGVSEGGVNRGEGRGDIGCVTGRGGHG